MLQISKLALSLVINLKLTKNIWVTFTVRGCWGKKLDLNLLTAAQNRILLQLYIQDGYIDKVVENFENLVLGTD